MSKPSAVVLAAGVILLSGAVLADELPVRDPTRPPSAGKQSVPTGRSDSLLLVSTSVSDGRGSAVINEEVVTVGSRIGGAVVTAIEPGRVTLARGSETILLQLFTPPVKKPARESS